MTSMNKYIIFASRTNYATEMNKYVFFRDALWNEYSPDLLAPFPTCTIGTDFHYGSQKS